MNHNNGNFFGLLIDLLVDIFAPAAKPGKDLVNQKIWDALTAKRIGMLHPAVRPAAINFINMAADEGIYLRAFSTLRTYPEQAGLYAKGRTKPGKIVTYAKPGESYHNFGLALDVVEIKNGKALWKNPNWTKIAQIGKKAGFEWGGDWKKFKDKPHFQMPFGKSLATLRGRYNAKPGQYVDLA